mgnify:CR=1 FL=1
MVLRSRALHRAGASSRTETSPRGGRVPGLQILSKTFGWHLLPVYGAPSRDSFLTDLPGNSPQKSPPPLLGVPAPPYTNDRLSAVKGSSAPVQGSR